MRRLAGGQGFGVRCPGVHQGRKALQADPVQFSEDMVLVAGQQGRDFVQNDAMVGRLLGMGCRFKNAAVQAHGLPDIGRRQFCRRDSEMGDGGGVDHDVGQRAGGVDEDEASALGVVGFDGVPERSLGHGLDGQVRNVRLVFGVPEPERLCLIEVENVDGVAKGCDGTGQRQAGG